MMLEALWHGAVIPSNGFSGLYIKMHHFSVVLCCCVKLPRLIQWCSCHRQHGTGPLLCMTAWNEPAELGQRLNTTLNTAPLQLHTLQTAQAPLPVRVSSAETMQNAIALPPLELGVKGMQTTVDASN